MDKDEIRRRLRDYNLKAVARACGMHQNSLYRFMSDRSDSRLSTVMKLIKYLQSEDAKHG